MKKRLSILLSFALVLVLAACGSSESKDEKTGNKEIIIGASNVPHAEILEEAAPLLKEKGIELKIETFQDYVLPNKALADKELDANYFQHIPYLEAQIAEHDYDFEIAGKVHLEPIGVYSKKYKSLEELPDGAEILMSNSVSDHGRILAMLEQKKLITLKEGVEKVKATVDDIEDNPKKLIFKTEYDPALLPQIYNNDEGDAILINYNYAIDAGLNPFEDAIAIEEKDTPYVNVVAVRKGDKDKEEIKALIEVLHSKEIQDFILEKYEGGVIPVSE
ncbi:MetQ/NlpA family ABC transporter substrate-binding protein [Bacillus aquiflavi]|uniref:Lipoprotein n=1 Tax=Bacillus aquiflavi TaxID=2672567 RepID=A0A6B3VVL6_9BACI|nr:MetQ/NlpA family ABC transporter substrate-binding protein [Bacillus aquiflavi]MBA4536924.1 MetQ/NlpA family ABC transporter substrate-binding protein [Bacillus aquiflavi]NEY82310.1 MetQ/NlpA family ABC transporter substrate-binding protein [Bacillus aquiflavi]UAC47740.1 MetQ/NlpA family ABC transporter substrate-binding protein [Bacillus aquiflavi]